MIAPVMISNMVPLLIAVAAFIFIYGTVFMLPRYVTYGTKDAPNSITVEATGYTAGPESTGKKPGDPGYGITATGTKAKRGTVAVDPSVIPFGTKMFIPGYGYGIAEDTGGAVKDNRIDLFFDSVEEAMAWGRRTVTVRLFTGEKSQASVAILSWGRTDAGWPLEKDEKLFEKYLELDSSWLNKFQSRGELLNSKVEHASGNAANPDVLVKEIWDPADVPAEKDQVSNHRVHWALLASLDRVLGDPIIHGEHGLETTGRGRKPDPEGHFKELEPKFEWETFELYYYHRWTVKSKDKDGNTITKTYAEEYRHPVKLLKKAQTYEANYAYFWREKVTEHSSDDSYTKITVPELQTLERRGPYYEKLVALLNRFGLTRLSNAEFVLQLAANFDDSFLVAGNLTSSFLEVSGSTENVAFSGEPGVMVRPVSGPLTSRFGYRVHPVTGQYLFHSGIDIGADEGTPVVAVMDGVVIFAGWNGGYGKCLIIDHGKYRTLYGHLSSYSVRPGDEVKGGQVLGKVGSTGISTGPHLHFEVRAGAGKTEFVDPLTLL